VTHDRRFIRPGDLVLEIEDGRIKGGRGDPHALAAGGLETDLANDRSAQAG
jgi:hypothetical protein